MLQAEKITGRQRKGGNKRARTKRERKGRRKTEDGAETGRKICLCVAGPGERKDGQRKRGCSLAPELDPAELVPTPLRKPCVRDWCSQAPPAGGSLTYTRERSISRDMRPLVLNSAPSQVRTQNELSGGKKSKVVKSLVYIGPHTFTPLTFQGSLKQASVSASFHITPRVPELCGSFEYRTGW